MASPSASTSAGGHVPMAAAESLGGPSMRATTPPSWSVATMAGSAKGDAIAAACAATALSAASASDARLRW